VKRLLHLLSHRLGWNMGRAYFWHRPDGVQMVGFKCETCGKIELIQPMWSSYRRVVK
jgi:hypothetical protein